MSNSPVKYSRSEDSDPVSNSPECNVRRNVTVPIPLRLPAVPFRSGNYTNPSRDSCVCKQIVISLVFLHVFFVCVTPLLVVTCVALS